MPDARNRLDSEENPLNTSPPLRHLLEPEDNGPNTLPPLRHLLEGEAFVGSLGLAASRSVLGARPSVKRASVASSSWSWDIAPDSQLGRSMPLENITRTFRRHMDHRLKKGVLHAWHLAVQQADEDEKLDELERENEDLRLMLEGGNGEASTAVSKQVAGGFGVFAWHAFLVLWTGFALAKGLPQLVLPAMPFWAIGARLLGVQPVPTPSRSSKGRRSSLASRRSSVASAATARSRFSTEDLGGRSRLTTEDVMGGRVPSADHLNGYALDDDDDEGSTMPGARPREGSLDSDAVEGSSTEAAEAHSLEDDDDALGAYTDDHCPLGA